MSLRTAILVLVIAVAAWSAGSALAEDLVAEAPRMLEEAVPLLEKVMGAKFKQPPQVLILSAEASLAVFKEDLRPEVLRRYPAATPGQRRTLLGALAAASVRSTVARYSVTRKSFVLVRESFRSQAAAQGFEGAAAREFLMAAIAHEAVHALDDQEFDLAALYGGAADREALRAVSMIIEGRAVHFGAAVAEKLGVRKEIRNLLPGGKKPKDRRAWTFHLTYQQGAAFTAALIDRGGLDLAARAMREPPKLTSFLFHPERWPDKDVDQRPAKLLRKVFPDAQPQPLSELELRARYADLDGLAAANELIAGVVGGSQWLWKNTNLAVLAFDTEEAARRYLQRSQKEVPAARSGTLLIRAAGPAAKEAVDLLYAAMESLPD